MFSTQPDCGGEKELSRRPEERGPGFVWVGQGKGYGGSLWFWFPVCFVFLSAALVSISFLLHVLNVPEGRHRQFWEGNKVGGCCPEIDMSIFIPASLNPPFCHLPSLPTSRRLLGAMVLVLLREFTRSLSLSLEQLPPNALPPGQSDLEGRSLPLVNGGCVSEL